jgi:hypothetical protein
MHVDQITQNVIVKIEKSRRVVELRPVCHYTVAETLRNFGGASAEGTSFLGGSWGMPPPENF